MIKTFECTKALTNTNILSFYVLLAVKCYKLFQPDFAVMRAALTCLSLNAGVTALGSKLQLVM